MQVHVFHHIFAANVPVSQFQSLGGLEPRKLVTFVQNNGTILDKSSIFFPFSRMLTEKSRHSFSVFGKNNWSGLVTNVPWFSRYGFEPYTFKNATTILHFIFQGKKNINKEPLNWPSTCYQQTWSLSLLHILLFWLLGRQHALLKFIKAKKVKNLGVCS